VALTNYPAVLWALGEESTVDETFSNAEQNRVTAFLNGGGRLFLSGSEIAWDLGRASGPTAADRSFLQNQLHVSLNGDTNDDAGTYSFAPVPGSIFNGGPAGRFDNGAAGIYDVRFPDVLTPSGPNGHAALDYTGGVVGAAAIQHADPVTGSRLVYFGFPFETITNAALREALMFDALSFFGVIPAPMLVTPSVQWPQGIVTLSWSAIPGRRYRAQLKNSLGDPTWTNLGAVVLATSNTASLTDAIAGNSQQRFYRVVMAD
jgi:hypothetical protein